MNKEALNKKVQEALNEIRPFLESDGGNIELVSIINDPPVIILASAFLQGYIPVSNAYLLGLQVADEE